MKLLQFIPLSTLGSLLIPTTTEARFGKAGKREISKLDYQMTTDSKTAAIGNTGKYFPVADGTTTLKLEALLGMNLNSQYEPKDITSAINNLGAKWENSEASAASNAITNSDDTTRFKRSTKKRGKYKHKTKEKYKNNIAKEQQNKDESDQDFGYQKLSSTKSDNKDLKKLAEHFKHSAINEITLDNYNFSMEIYSESEMQSSRSVNIDHEVSNTLKEWHQHYAPNAQHPLCKVQMYVFDNSESYNHFITKYKIGSPGSGGWFNHIGSENIILAYNQGFTYNVPHEVTHVLEYCNSNDLKFLSEGRAQYIQMLQDADLQASTMEEVHKNIAQITTEFIENFYSSTKKNPYQYTIGAALEAYFAKNNINTFQILLNDPINGPRYLASKINLNSFKDFVETKATPAYMKKINALPVQCNEEMYTYHNRYGSQMHVSKAIIQTNDGPVEASPISTILYSDSIRTTLADRKFYMDVDQKYRYLKLVIHNGKKALVFCNKDGGEFSGTTIYKNTVKYLIDSKQELTIEQKQDIKDTLTYLQPNNDLLQYSENTIFETKFPTNDKHALKYKVSILYGGAKIAELPTAEIFCIQENNEQKYVIFRDPINDVHSAYPDGSAYLGLVSGKDIYLLSGIPHQDKFITEKHIHYNPSFRMKLKDAFAPDQINNHPEKLMLQNVIVKNDGEKKDTLTNLQNANSLYLERGKLLDNRGSNATHDDRYEVSLKNADNDKNAITSKESYHIIAHMDKNSKLINKALVIEQHGPTRHFQFPNEIDSLKLKKLDNNSIVLVPCTKDGRENVPGMPEIPDELRQIPADHLYTFKNPEYSPSRAIATGISNLSSYKDGTIFNIRMAPEAEKQCTPGHTCGSYPIVQESSTNEIVGMLPINYNIYIDNTFNSINPNAALGHQVYQQPGIVPAEQASKHVIEIQQSKTALTNGNPAHIIIKSDVMAQQYTDEAVDVPPSYSHKGKRSAAVDEFHALSDLSEQLYSDDNYSHDLSGKSYDSYDSDVNI